tara:strand:+ start:431 stop:625 length:195 start_codon:yes stop_codon:yes gene_type:complete
VKVGDLVRNNHPSWMRVEQIGVIVGRGVSMLGASRMNKSFKVLWRDGTIGNNIWDYDLKIVKKS